MNLPIYPQLEEILEQPIIATLTDQQATSVDEGLSCLSELLYNQQGVSPRMWNIYLLIADSLLTDKGILDEFIDTISVPLINFMNKDPVTFRHSSLTTMVRRPPVLTSSVRSLASACSFSATKPMKSQRAVSLVSSLLCSRTLRTFRA
jgi:hypothetical protein